jgi:UDP-4-amino-4-deoxy-L-arabinose formyltransferase/UDP-glucuronic acid dehydrogenase (UDP-4-keto-hexauronic acid decarboxylating)
MNSFVIYTKAERGFASLTALLAQDLRPLLCVSEDGDPRTLQLCASAAIPLIIEKRPRSADHIARVHALSPAFLMCAGYSKILSEDLFGPMPLGGINCHGGRLPEYRGASPIPWQILNGEESGTAYVLRLTAGIDDGPILASERYSIEAEDTARHVTDKVTSIFSRIVPKVVRQFADGQPPAGEPQRGEACHWTRRAPEDGLIDWRRPVRRVVDLIRALDDPYPGAFVRYQGRKLVVWRARPFDRCMAGIAGRVVGRSPEGALVLASDGAVEILEFESDGVRLSGAQLPARYGYTFSAPLVGD